MEHAYGRGTVLYVTNGKIVRSESTPICEDVPMAKDTALMLITLLVVCVIGAAFTGVVLHALIG